jgi:hypothetical protein
MKLRLTSNSIRLRLSQTDVDRFRTDGVVEEELCLGTEPGQTFIYQLLRSELTDSIDANLENNQLTVSIPASEAAAWTDTDKVGIDGTRPNATNSTIAILVEKDFACMTPRAGDDDRDSFPNPAAPETC